MIEAKAVSVRNIAIYLTLSVILAGGFMIARPRQVVSVNTPVFMGEEITVRQAAKTVTASVVKPAAATLIKDAAVVKVTPAAPQAAPLPIVPPSIAESILPVYPAPALSNGVEGVVVLSVLVGLNGQPEKIETKNSSGNADLDSSAAAAVAQWKFLPATQGGAAIASRFEIPVKFVIR